MPERRAVMAINQCSRKMCMLSSYGLAVVCVVVPTVQYFFGKYKAVIKKYIMDIIVIFVSGVIS